LLTGVTLWLIWGRGTTSQIWWISLFILLQFAWSIWSWKAVTGTLLDPYVIFLVAAYLFNGGKAILEVFRLNDEGIGTFLSNDGYVVFSFSADTIAWALLLVFIGLGSVHLGALLAALRVRRKRQRRVLSKARSAQTVRRVGWFLLVISCAPMVITTIEKYQVVMQSGYFGLFQRAPETGFGNLPRILASFMIPGVLFLLAGSKDRPQLQVFSVLIILAYSLAQAFTGTRLWWVMFVVAYAWLWHRQIAPIPKVVLWTGASVAIFVIFPTIMVVRNLPGAERVSLSVYIEGFLSPQNPVIAILREMGGTLLTVAHTLELIPAVRNFDFGLGYLYSGLTVFPNLFWELHPAVARGLYSHWLTYMVSPTTYYAGGGYGFSFIAEAYANFGWIGAPILLGLVGFLFARFVFWGQQSGDPARSAAIAAFLAFFLIYVRGESALVVRPLIWYAFGPYFLTRLLSKMVRVCK
jgi:oligosaccharide repeat unit polymerase